jgi:hypothetical protein
MRDSKTGRRIEPGQGYFAGSCIKKVGRPALKREVVNYIVSHYCLRLRRACTLIKQTRSTHGSSCVTVSPFGSRIALTGHL